MQHPEAPLPEIPTPVGSVPPSLPPSLAATPSIRQIRAFLALAEQLQFTRAGQALNLSQPAITAQIAQLEALLGLRLFDRTKRAVALTEAGRNIRPLMESLAATLEALRETSDALGQGRRGLVRLAALPSLSARLLPTVITRFRARHPGIALELHDVVGDEVLRLVQEDQVDFGIGPRPALAQGLEVAPLMTDRLGAVFLPGHPLDGGQGPVRLAECLRFPLVLTRRNSSVRALFEQALAETGGAAAEPEVVLEVNYMSSALAAARAGLGVAILPASASEAGRAEGLRHRPLDTAAAHRALVLLWKRQRSQQPATQLFIEAVRAGVAAGEG